ncbi:MAG: beta-ketoacyl-ACP synthase II [Victivallaceae bacterium]|nr:beta-ketoacyl-ACP synthase II [Victivallaceae bacterium]NLK82915.1 beta-ketoacyl-ACP synthase II [Lentisphaerota bacterium]MDD3116052.1 beta-ketoacyl-ACP synthase II [Victivallaceae bacterium]MDD3703864.1 beta-ketoacyl-ACP synthase II [Victivallaceae bacterium]MDD4317334.1 beta-ketoacyl-ACP synthase II [Victivallaceae bacterium]
MNRRVVITGTGILSCVGNNVKDFWHSVVNGICGLDRITKIDVSQYRTQIGGEIHDFDITKYMPIKEAKRLDPFCQFAIAAADEALKEAGLETLDGIDRTKVGCLVSSGIGGLITLFDQTKVVLERGPSRTSPLLIPMMIGDMASGALSIRYGATGPNMGIVTACATGAHSIGESFWMIKRGDANVMISGGAEAAVTELGFAGFCAMKAMSQRNDDPKHASRPFDANRDGFVMSEGAGVLILEELEHAKRRGANILAEVTGYGATGDGYHITSPDPNGAGAARAITVALGHSGLNPDEVDYINAHGTSTELNDKYETKAIKAALGDYAHKVSVSSTKGTTGHSLGAAGGIECIACVKAIQNGIVPPTINYETPDPECDLDITPNVAKEKNIRVAINTNLGFGGHNAAIVFKKFEA